MGEKEDKAYSFGRYFEEFVIGDRYSHWPGKTITEAENHLFSLLTMNHHPIHLDANYASTTQFGKILVVGTLVFSLSVGLTVRDISAKAIANLEYLNIKHLAPVFIGDTLYAFSEVIDKKQSSGKPDRGVVHIKTFTQNQNNDIILSFERKILVPKKSAK